MHCFVLDSSHKMSEDEHELHVPIYTHRNDIFIGLFGFFSFEAWL